jgi:hypothetical protein
MLFKLCYIIPPPPHFPRQVSTIRKRCLLCVGRYLYGKPSFKIGVERPGVTAHPSATHPKKDKRADRHTSTPDRASPAAMSVLVKLLGLRREATLSGGAEGSLEKLENDTADVAKVRCWPEKGDRKSCPNGRYCRACSVAVHKARE